MLKKLARSAALGIVAAAAGAAGVGVGAFALYALLKDTGLGQEGAAAVVALLFLAIAVIALMIMRSGGKDHHQAQPQAGSAISLGGGVSGLKDRALTLAKERPLLAGAAGVIGAMYVLRNPAIVTALVGALAGRAEGKAEERRSGWF